MNNTEKETYDKDLSFEYDHNTYDNDEEHDDADLDTTAIALILLAFIIVGTLGIITLILK